MPTYSCISRHEEIGSLDGYVDEYADHGDQSIVYYLP